MTWVCAPRLEWLSNNSTARGVVCTFACSGQEIQLDPETEIALFRIVQEALSNIWRHANAHQASVELHYLPKRVRVSICDDGRGFAAEKPCGMGLSGMRERALLIGADLTVSSAPQNGCRVAVSLALP
jgi:signal transduction histidine kinase